MDMKKLIVSLLVVVAVAAVAFAGTDRRQLVTIPGGQTAITNAVFAGMTVSDRETCRLDSYAVGANAAITNLNISVRLVGATYTNDIPAVANAAGTALTPAAITVKQVVGAGDYFLVTVNGATNTLATQVYIDMQGQ